MQPRIVHGISPTSSSLFGHCWAFRGGKVGFGMAGYVDLERFTGKAIQLQIPWHRLLLASWPGGSDWRGSVVLCLEQTRVEKSGPNSVSWLPPLTPSLKTLRQLPLPSLRQGTFGSRHPLTWLTRVENREQPTELVRRSKTEALIVFWHAEGTVPFDH